MTHPQFRQEHEDAVWSAFCQLKRSILKGEIEQTRYPFPQYPTLPGKKAYNELNQKDGSPFF